MTVNPRTICVDVDNTLGDYTADARGASCLRQD